MLGREMGGLAEQIGLVSGGRRFAWAIPAHPIGHCGREAAKALGDRMRGRGHGAILDERATGDKWPWCQVLPFAYLRRWQRMAAGGATVLVGFFAPYPRPATQASSRGPLPASWSSAPNCASNSAARW